VSGSYLPKRHRGLCQSSSESRAISAMALAEGFLRSVAVAATWDRSSSRAPPASAASTASTPAGDALGADRAQERISLPGHSSGSRATVLAVD
jgi:hypothetical protein